MDVQKDEANPLTEQKPILRGMFKWLKVTDIASYASASIKSRDLVNEIVWNNKPEGLSDSALAHYLSLIPEAPQNDTTRTKHLKWLHHRSPQELKLLSITTAALLNLRDHPGQTLVDCFLLGLYLRFRSVYFVALNAGV